MPTEPMQTSPIESINARSSSQKHSLYDAIRVCRHPGCKVPFRPKRKDQVFHTDRCRKHYHLMAYRMGEAFLSMKYEITDEERGNTLPPPQLQSSYLKDSPASWAGLEGVNPGCQNDNHHQEVDYADRDQQ